MKQIIPFSKDIDLNSKISDITSIALEHNLKMENNDSVVGEFTISGKYKINDISINEEVFEKKIDFDITLDDKYDVSKVEIDIDDFYYEIINEKFLRVHIDVLVDNLVYIKKQEQIIEEQETPEIISLNDIKEEFKIPDERELIMKSEDIKEEVIIPKQDISVDNVRQDVTVDFSSNFLSEEEKYIMYKVHIIRENDTIDDLTQKYNVTKEELEKYNDLKNIILGTKVIIPINNE